MTRTELLVIVVTLLTIGCHQEPQYNKEPWIEKPISEWPYFSLTNEISFKDTILRDIANSFLVNTGCDTIGASCKHFFLLFEKKFGLRTISLADKIDYWKFYPKNNKEENVVIKRLINTNASEPVGQFNSLKVRDWIIFELEKQNLNLYPLKIRYEPVKPNEIVYTVGWGMKQKDNSKPALIKLQCVKDMGNYYYVTVKKNNTQPNGRSGSPVIDKNGYLVGIISGGEGKYGVIGSVNYLQEIFDTYNVEYEKSR